MITGSYRPNDAAALHRLPPIADGFVLRCHNSESRPLCHSRIWPRVIAIPQRRNVIRRYIDACHHRARLRTVKSP